MKTTADTVPFLTSIDAEDYVRGRYTDRSALALVVNERNEVLLHLRDDKPTILHPNCWSLLGGRCENGESEDAAVRRELLEEVSLPVTVAVPAWRFVERSGLRHLITTYIVPTSLPLSRLHLHEGQDFGFFSASDAFGLRLAPFVAPVLRSYFDSNRFESIRAAGTGE